MIECRRGGPHDLARAAAIKVDNWADTYRSLMPPQVLRRFLDADAQREELAHEIERPGALFLVATSSNEVVGFALAFLDEKPDPWLESLHVAGPHQGRGVGTLLMREVAGEALARGRSTLRLGVVRGNEGAGRLYERLGATAVALEPAPWAEGVDHVIYRWPDLAGLTGRLYNPAP